jgi:hypothetical protein
MRKNSLLLYNLIRLLFSAFSGLQNRLLQSLHYTPHAAYNYVIYVFVLVGLRQRLLS